MMNAETFATALGRKNIAAAIDVKLTAISNAIADGGFPPSWFIACKRLADEAGIECPPCLFKMKGIVPAQ